MIIKNIRSLAPLAMPVCVTFALSYSAQAQFSQIGPKLVGSGSIGNSAQGISVSVSADGNTAIVGGEKDNGGRGAAWIWERYEGLWNQVTKLVGTGAVESPLGSRQGAGVAISADSKTAIVGGLNDIGTWIWTKHGGVWTQQGSKLIPSDAPGFGFSGQGYSVALSADGNTALIGAPYFPKLAFVDNSPVGAAWVWVRNGEVWSQQGPKLAAADALGSSLQGISVALSGDGNTAIIGGPGDNSNAGAAWIWTRIGGSWIQQGSKLVGSDVELVPQYGFTGQQGCSVSLSFDGNSALIGAQGDYGPVYPSNNTGSARVWTRSAGIWTQQGAKLVGSGGLNACTAQGFSVSITGDGNTAVVGGVSGDSQTSTALIWKRNGGVWTEQGAKLVGTGEVGSGDSQQPSVSVSVSADSSTLIVGGSADNLGAGAVWMFAAPVPVRLEASIEMGEDGMPQRALHLSGPAGSIFQVETSSDLLGWTHFASPPNEYGSVTLALPPLTSGTPQFFRTKIP